MCEVVGFASRSGETLLFVQKGSSRVLHRAVFSAHVDHLPLQATMRIENVAVRTRIDQGAFVMLSVDFDQRARDRPQGLRAHRLIIDESAGPSVRHLHAAQHKIAVRVDRLVGRYPSRDVIAGSIKDRRDLTLRLSDPNKRAVAARAKRQSKGIEENGFSGARFAGQHRQSTVERKVEPVDEDDVANGQGDEHVVSPLRQLFRKENAPR